MVEYVKKAQPTSHYINYTSMWQCLFRVPAAAKTMSENNMFGALYYNPNKKIYWYQCRGYITNNNAAIIGQFAQKYKPAANVTVENACEMSTVKNMDAPIGNRGTYISSVTVRTDGALAINNTPNSKNLYYNINFKIYA